jgi:hypothetical protein
MTPAEMTSPSEKVIGIVSTAFIVNGTIIAVATIPNAKYLTFCDSSIRNPF